MQETTVAVACSDIDHYRRVRAIVKRLVIDLGYLESCQEQVSGSLRLKTGLDFIDTAIDVLNDYLETESQKIAPTTEVSAAKEIYPAVYPLPTDEN